MIGVPHGWRAVALGSLTQPSGISLKPTSDDDRVFLGMEHVESETTTILGVQPAASVRSNTRPFSVGDTLYGRLRPYLNKVCTPDFDGLASSEFMVFKPSEQLAPGYLKYFLNSPGFVRFANSVNDGDRPRVKWDQIRDFPVPVPPLDMQHRIVDMVQDLLWRLHRATAGVRDALRRLEQLEIADSATAISGGWEQTSLGDVAEVKAGPFGSSLTKASYSPTGYKVYGQEQVLRNDPYYGEYFVPESKYRELESCAVQPGDLLVSLVGTIGKTLLLPPDAVPGVINPRLVRIRPRDNRVNVAFIKAVLDSPITQARLRLGSHGGTMEILNATMLKSVEVPLPEPADQVRLVSALDQSRHKTGRLRQDLSTSTKRTDRFRSSILAAAFSGRLALPEVINV